jgi:hypothetical protein
MFFCIALRFGQKNAPIELWSYGGNYYLSIHLNSQVTSYAPGPFEFSGERDQPFVGT